MGCGSKEMTLKGRMRAYRKEDRGCHWTEGMVLQGGCVVLGNVKAMVIVMACHIIWCARCGCDGKERMPCGGTRAGKTQRASELSFP